MNMYIPLRSSVQSCTRSNFIRVCLWPIKPWRLKSAVRQVRKKICILSISLSTIVCVSILYVHLEELPPISSIFLEVKQKQREVKKRSSLFLQEFMKSWKCRFTFKSANSLLASQSNSCKCVVCLSVCGHIHTCTCTLYMYSCQIFKWKSEKGVRVAYTRKKGLKVHEYPECGGGDNFSFVLSPLPISTHISIREIKFKKKKHFYRESLLFFGSEIFNGIEFRDGCKIIYRTRQMLH